MSKEADAINMFLHLEARIALLAIVMFALLVSALHVLKPGLKPSQRMISEYAMKPRGWLMQLAFYCMAVGCLTLSYGIWAYIPGSLASSIMLAIAGVGAVGAGFFVTDPLNATREESTMRGLLHVVFSFIFIPFFSIAATLIAWNLNADGTLLYTKHYLPWACALVWIGIGVFVGGPIFVKRSKNNRQGPPIGFFQRFMVLTYVLFLVLTSITLGWTI
jgi:hypothetical protein